MVARLSLRLLAQRDALEVVYSLWLRSLCPARFVRRRPLAMAAPWGPPLTGEPRKVGFSRCSPPGTRIETVGTLSRRLLCPRCTRSQLDPCLRSAHRSGSALPRVHRYRPGLLGRFLSSGHLGLPSVLETRRRQGECVSTNCFPRLVPRRRKSACCHAILGHDSVIGDLRHRCARPGCRCTLRRV